MHELPIRDPHDPQLVALALRLSLQRCEHLERTLTGERKRHTEARSTFGWVALTLGLLYLIGSTFSSSCT